ncbi:MAG: TonB-dependent receptor [Pleurocapsa sp. MO_226.B13]|nr:TonB-dependent receptor [Pleurocapsa sp. MO_226.B13]
MPVGAESKIISEKNQTSDRHQPNLDRQNSARDLLVQINDNEAVAEITGVEINSTTKGLELILETAGNERLIPLILPEDNNLIIDILDAVLALPEGEKFPITNPAPGITAIDINQVDATSVRITVRGEAQTPSANVVPSPKNLVLSLTTERDGTATETAAEPIEIIVTAEKTPENVQDVPASITVFTQEQIEDANLDRFDDVAQNTPNFTFFPGGENRTAAFYSLRGITNFNAFSRDAIGFFIDDVPYDFAGFIDQNFIDIERIEVLRGPQNILYGRSSLGGVINIVSRRPTNTFEFDTVLSYGNFDDFEAQASISDAIIKDKLAYRLSGSYSTQDGYVENTFLDEDVDGGTSATGRAQILWTPSENWEVLLNASLADYDEGAQPFVLVGSDPFEAELDFDGFNELNTNAQSLRVGYTHPKFRLTSITAHRFSSQEAALDQDATIEDIEINAPDFDSRVITQELRLQSPEAATPFTWIVGGYFESSEFNNDRSFLRGAASPFPGEERGDSTTDSTAFALFGQTSYRVSEALNLTAGLRYETTNTTTDAQRVLIATDGTTITLLDLQDIEADGSELLPRFAVEYDFNPNLTSYASITKGYRPPGASFDPFSEDTATFEAETAWSYELGLKSAWLQDRLLANLAVFYSPVSDFQFPSLQGGEVVIDNADVDIFGTELELITRPVEGLEIVAGLGLLSAEFSNGNDPFTGESLAGKRTPFNPNLTYNLAIQYLSKIGISGRIELTGFGSTFFDDRNQIEQEPFALVNAKLGYEFEDYGIFLLANNIFDQEYLTQAADFGMGIIGTYGAPRTVGVQVRAKF